MRLFVFLAFFPRLPLTSIISNFNVSGRNPELKVCISLLLPMKKQKWWTLGYHTWFSRPQCTRLKFIIAQVLYINLFDLISSDICSGLRLQIKLVSESLRIRITRYTLMTVTCTFLIITVYNLTLFNNYKIN